ncbi:MAG: tetratricopeptide repeat protein [Eubacterium sp.]|nr:tetratricopeptide repeat protein [Eubacterium sp.]
MLKNSQDGFQTLGWIIDKSEQGLYLVVAEERIQKEIVGIYRRGGVEIYDYKQHPGAYSFRDLQEWVLSLPETRVFMIANFHLALQDEESLRRLNFSRDMIDGLGKNFIFLITPYGDDSLVCGAYDFYSFVKLRILFDDETESVKAERLLPEEEELVLENVEEPEVLKQKLAEAYDLIEQAKEEKDKGHYFESEKMLLRARKIKEKLLGPEHLEMAEIDSELAEVYINQGRYKEAEELNQKSLSIREKVLGEEHPDTAAGYNNLAVVYESQGRYKEAEELNKKSLSIREKVLGEGHPQTAESYSNLALVYESQGRYKKAEELHLKSIRIKEKVLGEEHPDTVASYNNLAVVYGDQGRYKEAEELYQKSLSISEKVLGEEHPDTAVGYHNLAGCMIDREGIRKRKNYIENF